MRHLVGIQTVAGQLEADSRRTGRAVERTVVDFVCSKVIGIVVADMSFGEAVKLVRTVEVHAPNLYRSIPGGPQ